MTYRDLREWIEKVDALGELARVDGADWNLEIGGITDMVSHQPNAPALLFDKIKDYPAGYRVISNMMGNTTRLGVTLGLPLEKNRLEFLKLWREKFKAMQAIPPVEVSTGPVIENMHKGDNINVLEFPAPFWHERDGGRFLGTADVAITRDPDSGWVNLGIWRGQVHGPASVGATDSPDRHATQHMKEYWAQGKPFPAAVCYGADPLLFLLASMNIPEGLSELDVAGGLRGAPVEVIKSDLTGLPIPAYAEIVAEGFVTQGDVWAEGPFGEWAGYYSSGIRKRPIFRIQRLYHRNDPIITGAPPIRPPSANAFLNGIRRSEVIWDQMEAAGVPGIKGVWSHEASGGPLFTVISVKQLYPGHSKQAAMVACNCREGLRNGKYVVVVDEDIDPSNLDEVIFAISTRSEPSRSIDILDRCLGSNAVPSLQPREDRRGLLNSRAVIDACRPYEWMHEFAPVVEISPEYKEVLREKWKGLII